MADTGVSVATKGVWYPDRSMVKDKDPPLYLHITAVSHTTRLNPTYGIMLTSPTAYRTRKRNLKPESRRSTS